jgi:hypothetical protein
MDFLGFPKMARLSREIVITEKIDGTNAMIGIEDIRVCAPTGKQVAIIGYLAIYAQSRTRFITPGDDNFGFAKWVWDFAPLLLELGPGQHFGEWWGQGIQRKYGLAEKHFSLFNVHRWGEVRPSCCHVVPVLYRGAFDTECIDGALSALASGGSHAAPGFMKPEGIVIYHTAAGLYFKKTIEKDEAPKSLAEAA